MTENFKLSSHLNSLCVLEKARYIEKLKLVQCDCPYIIPENLWKYGPALAGFIAPTNKEEIFMHLIVKHSHFFHNSSQYTLLTHKNTFLTNQGMSLFRISR
ncbi:hypothetical protein OUZ56_010056 [Daphnia magna]|uniref:Uncharacterized protein n=1 Tax=Daphnia magna TaxID=35525 RepID=A0ABR0AHN1_9CRUS|nr:hypothetical protein OUZ56_010056 [Daphnia magna]